MTLPITIRLFPYEGRVGVFDVHMAVLPRVGDTMWRSIWDKKLKGIEVVTAVTWMKPDFVFIQLGPADVSYLNASEKARALARV